MKYEIDPDRNKNLKIIRSVSESNPIQNAKTVYVFKIKF